MTETFNTKSKRVLIVEDHPLFRAMLAQLVSGELEMTVCGETDNIESAMAMIEETHPDIAIIDITLQGASGLDLIKDIKAREIPLPVLVLSMHEEKLYAERTIRAGARGYVSKQEPPSAVAKAIRGVMAGQICVSDRVAGKILERLTHYGQAVDADEMEVLSDREMEVFQLLGHGLNSREISKRIHLGSTTVDTYRQRIKEKLGVKNAAELYQRAARWVGEREI